MSADFLDSNVLVYLFDETDSAKRSTARELVERGLESGEACISFQVVQETLHVVIRKLGATPDDARRLLESVLAPLLRVLPSVELYRRGIELQARHRLSFFDALIVAAALEAGCTRLWSEDLQDGQRFDRLTVRNPFAALPAKPAPKTPRRASPSPRRRR